MTTPVTEAQGTPAPQPASYFGSRPMKLAVAVGTIATAYGLYQNETVCEKTHEFSVWADSMLPDVVTDFFATCSNSVAHWTGQAVDMVTNYFVNEDSCREYIDRETCQSHCPPVNQ